MIHLCAFLTWNALECSVRLVFKALRQWRTARKMQSWAEHHLDEVAEDFNSTDEVKKPMALDFGTRTSTNTVVGAGIIGTVYVQLVGILPFPDLVAALTTPQMIVVVTSVIAWAVARISKTPANPGTL